MLKQSKKPYQNTFTYDSTLHNGDDFGAVLKNIMSLLKAQALSPLPWTTILVTKGLARYFSNYQ